MKNLAEYIGKTIESIKLINDDYNCITTGIIIKLGDKTNITINAETGKIDNELKKYLRIT
jgi:hypothetical protein